MQLERAAAKSTVDALRRAHEAVVETCKKSKAVVLKSIRVRDGLSAPVIEASGLKLLQLVRDPRAVVRSELETMGLRVAKDRDPSFNGWGSLSIEAAEERAHRVIADDACDIYSHQLAVSEALSDDRYLLVRYEDFATLPKVEAELVYRWSGLGKTPEDISSWIDDNTKMSNCDPPAEHGATRRLVTTGNSSSLRGADASQSAYHSLPNAKNQEEVPRMLQPTRSTKVDNDSGGVEGGVGGGSGGGGGGGGNNLRGIDALKHAFHSSLITHQEEKEPVNNNNNKSSSGGDEVRRVLKKISGNISNDSGGGEIAGSGGGGGGGKKGGGQGGGCSSQAQSEKHPFSTQRESADMVNQWRTQMPKKYADIVWSQCKESGVMADLGYEY